MQAADAPATARLEGIDLLLESCSFITETALSCRTLEIDTASATTGTSSSCGSASVLIQKEQETADWLDRNIVDYRAALSRRLRNTIDSETETTRQQLRLRQQELLDESIRQQQEELLLWRIEMAPIAQDTVMCSPSNTTSRSARDASEALLVQEAIKSRDEQVTQSLEKVRQLNFIRAQLHDDVQECLRLQDRNRSLWQQVVGSKMSNGSSNASSETRTLAAETLILKRALQDVIVGSGLDWYSDKRLRRTMAKLER